jgi:signal transduction histidine kinase
VLIVEDSEEDTKMIVNEFKRGGYEATYTRVDNASDMQAALLRQKWDLVLSDYAMPDFDAISALRVLQGTLIDLPFIIVSGSIGEDTAVQAMKAGAHDYLMKDKLSRLLPAIERELREATIRRERREAEQALKQAYEELEARVQERTAELAKTNALLQEAIHARDEFISIAAHELKTPVTSMLGFAQTLLRQLDKGINIDPAKMRRGLTLISQQSEKLNQFILQLMDIARIEAGRLAVERQLTDIIKLVENVAEVIQMGTNTHSIRVHSDAPIVAHVDPLRLEQVLSNLLNNAVKYSPDGGMVNVNVNMVNASTMCISVTDQGPGIPVEHRPHIFERFYQVNRAGHFGGLGIGLYVSHQIVALHGGQITAEFPAEGGTRFLVTLPVNN